MLRLFQKMDFITKRRMDAENTLLEMHFKP